MATILTALFFVIGAIIFVFGFAFMYIALIYLSWFKLRRCKHCNHILEYRGLKPDENNGHYLFHCTHCGAWEQVPKEEFIRSIDKGFDPREEEL